MRTSQMQFLNEIKAGHDGAPIPEATRAYFQQRLRNRFFEFILNRFVEQQKHGLTKAKLARRIGKTPDIVNRWLSAPSNLTLDTASDLLLGIKAEELEMGASSLLNRMPVNYNHLAEFHDVSARKPTPVEITSGTVKAQTIHPADDQAA
jgi:Helix-turn-helix